MPKVSIIVPNYNHSLYLPKRMESILNQTYQDFEVIILDDFSTDNSKEIIEQYRNHPKVSRIVYNELNGGTSYKQWYKGIEYAQCELIWIAESDDWCDLHFLEYLVPHFVDNETVIAFSNTLFMFDGDAEQKVEMSSEFQKSTGVEFVREIMLSTNRILNASMVVFRKDSFRKIDDPSWKEMKLAGDWYLWTQILRWGNVVEVFSEFNFCRRHTENATQRFRKLGSDFLEGLIVLDYGKRICENRFSRKQVYFKWVDFYKNCKVHFNPGVNQLVLKKFLMNEPLIFYYFVYVCIYKNYRKIFYSFKQMIKLIIGYNK